MTDLRDQLRDARRAYDSAAYPGDLAAELLPPSRPAVRGWIVTLAVAAAVAATFAVVLRPAGPDPIAPAPPAGPVVARAVIKVEPKPATRPADPPAKPTSVAAAAEDDIPLPLPAGPLFPASVPIHVSLSSLQADLSRLGSYPELMPWLREQWEGTATDDAGQPAPKAPSAAPPRAPGEAS